VASSLAFFAVLPLRMWSAIHRSVSLSSSSNWAWPPGRSATHLRPLASGHSPPAARLRPLASGRSPTAHVGAAEVPCAAFQGGKKTLMDTHKHYNCGHFVPGRAGIRARFARIARGGHGHPFIERRLWDGGMVSKLSKRFDFNWSRKWVRVI
jgi:hypothetical protein